MLICGGIFGYGGFSAHRSQLCQRSLAVFEQNHNIVRQRKDLRSLLSGITTI